MKRRLLRTIEYVGTEEWIKKTLATSLTQINGTKRVGNNYIKSGIIGDTDEFMPEDENKFMKISRIIREKSLEPSEKIARISNILDDIEKIQCNDDNIGG